MSDSFADFVNELETADNQHVHGDPEDVKPVAVNRDYE
jgi:hypothetical protein